MVTIDLRAENLDEVIKLITNTDGKIFNQSKRSALSSVGYYLKQEVENWIDTGGQGTWKKRHPLTAKHRRKFKDRSKKFGRRRRGRESSERAGTGLAKYIRYRVGRRLDFVSVGAGFSQNTMTSQTPTNVHSRSLSFIFQQFQASRTFSISDKREKVFGFQKKRRGGKRGFPKGVKRRGVRGRRVGRRRKRPIVGKDIFFPGAKKGKIDVPARPIFDIVFKRNRARIIKVYQDKFRAALKKRGFVLS